MVAFFLPKTQSVQKERWLRPRGGRPFVATGDLTRLQSCRFCDALTTQEKQSAASVADKEPAGDRQALYSRGTSSAQLQEATAMLPCPNYLSPKNSGTGRRFCLILAVVVLVPLGYLAPNARAQDRPSEDLRRR